MKLADENPTPAAAGREKFWRAAAAALLVLAVLVGWWRYDASGQADAAFVLATLGVVAWFLSLRNRLHAANIERDRSHFSTAEEELDER